MCASYGSSRRGGSSLAVQDCGCEASHAAYVSKCQHVCGLPHCCPVAPHAAPQHAEVMISGNSDSSCVSSTICCDWCMGAQGKAEQKVCQAYPIFSRLLLRCHRWP